MQAGQGDGHQPELAPAAPQRCSGAGRVWGKLPRTLWCSRDRHQGGRQDANQSRSVKHTRNSFLRDKCLQRKPWETPTTCSACSVAERTAFITATCRGRVPAEHPPNFSLLQPSSPCSPRCPPRGRRVAFAAQWSCPWGVLAGLQLPTLPARTQSCPNKSQNGKRQWPARMHLSLLFP